jgi:hypothetical protein
MRAVSFFSWSRSVQSPVAYYVLLSRLLRGLRYASFGLADASRLVVELEATRDAGRPIGKSTFFRCDAVPR